MNWTLNGKVSLIFTLALVILLLSVAYEYGQLNGYGYGHGRGLKNGERERKSKSQGQKERIVKMATKPSMFNSNGMSPSTPYTFLRYSIFTMRSSHHKTLELGL